MGWVGHTPIAAPITVNTQQAWHAQGLREWQAYKDCRDIIDDFLEQLPLFQALADTSMRERWDAQCMGTDGHWHGQHRAACSRLRWYK